jgi:hypothetical protein
MSAVRSPSYPSIRRAEGMDQLVDGGVQDIGVNSKLVQIQKF